MNFEILDRFFEKTDREIDNEYQFVSTKEDDDKLLIIVLNLFKKSPTIFSREEIHILSIIAKIRLSSTYVEFKRIYPILKSAQYSSYEENMNLLSSLISNNQDEEYEFEIKEEHFNKAYCSSPLNHDNKELPNSYVPPTFFGCNFDLN